MSHCFDFDVGRINASLCTFLSDFPVDNFLSEINKSLSLALSNNLHMLIICYVKKTYWFVIYANLFSCVDLLYYVRLFYNVIVFSLFHWNIFGVYIWTVVFQFHYSFKISNTMKILCGSVKAIQMIKVQSCHDIQLYLCL